MTDLPLVLLTDPLPPVAGALAEFAEVVNLWETPDPAALAAQHKAPIRVIAAGPKGRVDRALIDALPALEFIAKFGAGYELVDTSAARERGVIVANTPGVMAPEVADFAIGLLLGLLRDIPGAQAFLRSGQWVPGSHFRLTPSLRGRTVGILGLGRIGLEIARRLEGFDVPVAYCNRSQRSDVSYDYYPTPVELAGAADILIIAAPGGEETRGLVDAATLAALGANGVVVNVGRGTVIDQDALIVALESGTILGAALDSFVGEPAVPERLLAAPNVLLTPHVGSGSVDTIMKMCGLMVQNIRGWLDGTGPLTPVAETPWTAHRVEAGA